MARKNIFDVASDSLDIRNEASRIVKMFYEDDSLYFRNSGYTLVEYVEAFAFEEWKWRGHFIDVDDFLDSVGFDDIVNRCSFMDIEAFFLLVELVYNFWELANRDLTSDHSELAWGGNFFHLEHVMNDNLQKYNHKAYKHDDRVLIIEDKPEITAVAEIVEENLATQVIRYNHRSLKGDLDSKKQILIVLGAELEPKRKSLQELNKQLSEDIFFMLNNIDIRHNNRNPMDPSKYKEFVYKMDNDQLEEWYDELYQMMLLAILLLDNVDRCAKVKDLKSSIIEE